MPPKHDTKSSGKQPQVTQDKKEDSAGGKAMEKVYDVVIERTELLQLDPTYIRDWQMQLRRANRTAPYTLSCSFYNVYPSSDNVTISIRVYEKLNSEYKLTPLQMQGRLCRWMRGDRLVLAVLQRYSREPITCPLQGHFKIENAIIDAAQNIPTGFWPFENNKLRIQVTQTVSRRTILDINIYFKCIEKPHTKTT